MSNLPPIIDKPGRGWKWRKDASLGFLKVIGTRRQSHMLRASEALKSNRAAVRTGVITGSEVDDERGEDGHREQAEEVGMLRKYLNQPSVIEEMLGLKNRVKVKDAQECPRDPDRTIQDLFDGLPTSSVTCVALMDKSPMRSSTLAVDGGAMQPGFRIPLYNAVSPRTRRKIQLLPRPSTEDLDALRKVEGEIGKEPVSLDARKGLYRVLHRTNPADALGDENTKADVDALNTQLKTELKANIRAHALSRPAAQRKRKPVGEHDGTGAETSSKQSHAWPTLPVKGREEEDASVEKEQWPPPDTSLSSDTGGGDFEAFREDHTRHVQDRIKSLRGILNTTETPKVELAHMVEDLRAANLVSEGEEHSQLVNKLELLERMTEHLWRSYYSAYATIGWRRWLAYTEAMVLQEHEEAICVIQTRVRQWQAQAMVKTMRVLEARRVERERARIANRVSTCAAAALAIQTSWRRHAAVVLAGQLKRELRSIQLIQKNYRKIKDYRKVRIFAVLRGKRDQSATTIQAAYRGYCGRVRYRLLKKIKRVKEKQDLKKFREETRLEGFRRTGAALSLQRFWRKVRERRQQMVLTRVIRSRKAVIIQKYYRRFAAKLLAKRIRKEIVDSAKRNSAAVLLLQCQVRMYLAKCKYDRRLFLKEKAALVRRMEKEQMFAKRLVKGCGGYVLLDKWKAKEIGQRLLDLLDFKSSERHDKAATYIQRMFRGHRARRRVRFMREMDTYRAYDRAYKRRFKAARDIQRVFRGIRARRSTNRVKRLKAVILMQKVLRGFVRRAAYARVRARIEAATVVQKFARRWLARRLYNVMIDTFRRQRQKAIAIQVWARGVLARMHVPRKLEFDRRMLDRRVAAVRLMSLKLRMIGHKLLLESLTGGWEYKATYKFGKAAYEFRGEASLIFSHFAASKNEEKLDNMAFVMIMRQSPGVFTRYFNETDADLLFAKLKPSPSVKYITQNAFKTALETVSTILFADQKRYCYRRGKDARVLRLLCEHILPSEWAEPYKMQLDMRTQCYVDMLWARVQAWIRGWLERVRHQQRILQSQHAKLAEAQILAAVKIQAVARRVKARMAAVKLAQETYVKYIDPVTKQPYWYHNRTKKSVWVKPSVFGPFDVKRAKELPTKAVEFLILCVNCDSALGAVLCEACEEVYCRDCFEGIHLKGHKRLHKPRPVEMCLECNVQMATRRCRQCSFNTGSSINYCDVCYFNVHQDPPSYRQHRAEDIVMRCVECEKYTARWRCNDCHDLYCTHCFSRMHARGKRIQHKYDALRYYTSGMHRNYEYQLAIDAKGKKIAEHMMILQRVRHEKRNRAATIIQKVWRGRLGRAAGRSVLKLGRQKLRAYYRLRKAEDAVRATRSHKFFDFWGLAWKLRSDTMEERVLKHFPVPFRSKLRQRILRNVEFMPGMMKDHKKVPRRGFDYGTEAEHVQQCRYGGTRLPGLFTIQEGERVIHTTADLTGVLKPQSRIRIKNLHYSVDYRRGVTAEKIHINRLWRRDDAHNIPMYRMPDLRWFERPLHVASTAVLQSTMIQKMVLSRMTTEGRIEKALTRASDYMKSKGMMQQADFFKAAALRSSMRARRIGYFLKEQQEKYTQNEQPTVEAVDVKELEARLVVMEQEAKRIADAKYIGKEESVWEDGKDSRSGKRFWRNKQTSEVTYDNPFENLAKDKMTVAQHKMMEAKHKREAKAARRTKIR